MKILSNDPKLYLLSTVTKFILYLAPLNLSNFSSCLFSNFNVSRFSLVCKTFDILNLNHL